MKQQFPIYKLCRLSSNSLLEEKQQRTLDLVVFYADQPPPPQPSFFTSYKLKKRS